MPIKSFLIAVAAVILFSIAGHAQTKVDPSTQILWPSCTSAQAYGPNGNQCLSIASAASNFIPAYTPPQPGAHVLLYPNTPTLAGNGGNGIASGVGGQGASGQTYCSGSSPLGPCTVSLGGQITATWTWPAPPSGINQSNFTYLYLVVTTSGNAGSYGPSGSCNAGGTGYPLIPVYASSTGVWSQYTMAVSLPSPTTIPITGITCTIGVSASGHVYVPGQVTVSSIFLDAYDSVDTLPSQTWTNIQYPLFWNSFSNTLGLSEAPYTGVDLGTTGTAYSVIAPAFAQLVPGITFNFFPAHANTSTTPTLSLNGLVNSSNLAPTIAKNGQPLAANDMITSQMASVLWDGNYMELLNPQTSGSGIGGSGTTNTLPKFTSPNTVGNSSISDNGTIVATPEPIGVGSSPPSGCPTSGCIALAEASSPGTPTAGVDYMRADSVTHTLLCSLNGGSETACAGNGSSNAFPFTIIQTDVATFGSNTSFTYTPPAAAQSSGATALFIFATDGSGSFTPPTGATCTVNTTACSGSPNYPRLAACLVPSSGQTSYSFSSANTVAPTLRFYELSGSRTFDQVSSGVCAMSGTQIKLPALTPTSGSAVWSAATFVTPGSASTTTVQVPLGSPLWNTIDMWTSTATGRDLLGAVYLGQGGGTSLVPPTVYELAGTPYVSSGILGVTWSIK